MGIWDKPMFSNVTIFFGPLDLWDGRWKESLGFRLGFAAVKSTKRDPGLPLVPHVLQKIEKNKRSIQSAFETWPVISGLIGPPHTQFVSAKPTGPRQECFAPNEQCPKLCEISKLLSYWFSKDYNTHLHHPISSIITGAAATSEKRNDSVSLGMSSARFMESNMFQTNNHS